LNFGNPEHPEVMWQFSEAIDGMGDACRAFGLPVIGGNVSLYNESRGANIDPTPVVAVLGLVDRLDRPPPGARLVGGATIALLGEPGPGELGGSRWAWDVRRHRGGRVPALDFDAHLAVAGVVREMVNDGLLAGVHDCGDGGLGLGLAEMSVHSGVGFSVSGITDHAQLFGESPSRVLLAVAGDAWGEVETRAANAQVPLAALGRAGGDRMTIVGLVDVPVAAAAAAWRDRLPHAFGVGSTH
jgi:phosphoribosylformylglycinamidine synthase